MQRLLSLISTRTSSATRRSVRRARPCLEGLERREVMTLVALTPPMDISPNSQGGQTAGLDRLVAQAADGHFVTVWNDSAGGIKARLFNADGSARSGEFAVGSGGTKDASPSIAMNASGTFVVAWNHDYSPTDRDVYAQVFQPDGSVKGTQMTIAARSLDEYAPSAGIDSAGDFAVAYVQRTTATNTDIKLVEIMMKSTQIFMGSSYTVKSYDVATTVKNESRPSLAMNGAGSMVVAYGLDYSATDQDVLTTYFAASGTTYPTSIAASSRKELAPSAAINARGDFAVGFVDVASETTSPGSGLFPATTDYATNVRVAVYSAAGTWLRTVDAANDPKVDEYDPSITLKSDDSVQVAYTSGGQYDPLSLYPSVASGMPLAKLRAFNAAGTRTGETTVGMAWLQNTKNATRPSLAIGSDTTGVLLWESSVAKPVNTVTGNGVFAQSLLDLPFQETVSLPGGASELPLYNGMGTSFTVQITRDPGFAGAVDLSIGSLPAGYTAAVKTNQVAIPGGIADTRTVTITAPAGATTSKHFNITVQAGVPGLRGLNIAVPVGHEAFRAGTAFAQSGYNGFATPQQSTLAGTTVRIDGTGYAPGMKVEFPSNSATPLSVPVARLVVDPWLGGSCYVEVQVPAGAISGPLTLVNPAGVRSTTTNSLTITGPKVVSVSQMWGVTPREMKPGTLISIRGVGFAPGTTVTFGDVAADPGTLTISPNGTQITVNVPRLAVHGDLVVHPVVGPALDTGRFEVASFRERNAFSFQNNIHFSVGTGLVMDAFGSQAVAIRWPNGDRTPSPGAFAFSLFASATMGNGVCFGLALTAERMMQHPDWIGSDAFPLIDTSGPRTINNVELDGNSLQQFEMQHLYQYSQEVIDYYVNWQKTNHSSTDVYNQIRDELLAGRHPLISMQEGLGSGHVVLAYDLEGTPSHFWIDTYDPNAPYTPGENTDADLHRKAEEGSRVEILPDNRWMFHKNDTDVWEGGFGTLMVLPTSVIPPSPTMASVFDTVRGIVFGSSDSHAPSAGRHTTVAASHNETKHVHLALQSSHAHSARPIAIAAGRPARVPSGPLTLAGRR